ncbi:MAG: NAD(P)-binding domain-containing protein [Myxococcota bacterium]|nr:NAD(P)-binding domain-containing protein [Myxococcota bacterium]
MRLLIADKLHPRAIEELRTLPLEVVYEPELTKESLDSSLQGVGILVVRSTEVTASAIENAKRLNLIVRAGASFDTIDVRAASKRGIYVANCPGRNASAVAEIVFGLLIALDRRVPDAVASLRAGKWERKEYSKAEGLHGKTMGIVGLGAIGREVAARARCFGLHVVGWGRSLTPTRAAELGIGYAASLEELASRSQVLSLHLALVDRTRGIISRRILDLLPERTIVINTARADLIDGAALLEAAQKRGFRVGLDVFPDEPRGGGRVFTSPEIFQNYPSGGVVYGTPHISAATDQAQLAIASETVRIIRSFLLEATVPNVVNVSSSSAARFQLVVRMMDKVGTFAHVLSVLKRHGINVEEVSNTVFEGGVAACAKARLVSRPTEACLAEIKAFDEVLHVDLVTLPMLA